MHYSPGASEISISL